MNHERVGRAGTTVTARRIVVGQYLGSAGILAVAVAGAFGVTFLPEAAIPYLGLLPLALGMKAAWRAWRHRDDGGGEQQTIESGPKTLEVSPASPLPTAVIGVYVSVFATAGVGEMSVYAVAFLILVALWCFAGRFFATRPVIGSTQPAGRASDLLLF